MGDPGRRHRSPARRPGATQLYLRRLAAGEARNLPAPRRGQAQTTTAKDISRRNLILTHMGQRPLAGSRGRAPGLASLHPIALGRTMVAAVYDLFIVTEAGWQARPMS